ncbi:Clan CA, family C19, ubiquitin hydrolase-like cysteine peptidase [Trichomonas vaginalis G3]|uniref:Clan CA, family C19, ubiquitin hydrolase-like cysteine peptidase n=1 Tax=Trichomonas vaginalis (strain ATCC PRA-98 / G3) TaxID=412133 RepID=A2E6Q9_TRIV3|nr:ubiquitinyl hydrolase protein [Trichomonas vaginalis G3]EAY11653.1 Clan CA, family C19, ubiquitin hydrolase-like cysteine peptidase [Trichomonas vaginalis G3]KAI5494942.1 ubiquitinyl hydrolase protein [Trichomonas vaginalis G3]|eukprot:XP_001323876.1 Clan CA, family C19, ubiquitin hydrolase-like cysteine peptidase [Trichomonas vaginalis G3]
MSKQLFTLESSVIELKGWNDIGTYWNHEIDCSESEKFEFTIQKDQNMLKFQTKAPIIQNFPSITYEIVFLNKFPNANVIKRVSKSPLTTIVENYSVQLDFDLKSGFEENNIVKICIKVIGSSNELSSNSSPIKPKNKIKMDNERHIFPKIPIRTEILTEKSQNESDDENFDVSQNQLILTQIPNNKINKYQENGIVNQGATCYLNTIIQVLYHIPLFRKIVYSSNSQNNILISFQNLFASLQLFDGKPAQTKELTTAFGWSYKDTLTQQDAHEFFLSLFQFLPEELQKVFKSLFQGVQKHYIRCTNVPHSSEFDTDLMNISLDIDKSNNIEECLEMMLKSEFLTGANQYFAGEYGKQDAHIGIEFEELPKVLCFHLKRFEFDESKGNEKKSSQNQQKV